MTASRRDGDRVPEIRCGVAMLVQGDAAGLGRELRDIN